MTISLVALNGASHENGAYPHQGPLSSGGHYMFRSQKGQGLAEYALILALIALVVIGAVIFLGGNIQTIMNHVAGSI